MTLLIRKKPTMPPRLDRIHGQKEVFEVERLGEKNTRIKPQSGGESRLSPTEGLEFFTETDGVRIPETPLRKFYQWLKPPCPGLGCGFLHEPLAKGFVDCPDKLSKLFQESVRQFAEFPYINQPFHPDRGEGHERRKGGTTILQTMLEKQKALSIVDANRQPEERFLYLDRELATARIEGVRVAGDNRGGRGGIDFLLCRCLNEQTAIPVVAEVKIGSDNYKTAFFALIQALTYAAELSSPNQQKRIGNHYLKELGTVALQQQNQVELLLLFVQMPENEGLKKVLVLTEQLIGKLLKDRAFTTLVPRIVVAELRKMPTDVFEIPTTHRRVYAAS